MISDKPFIHLFHMIDKYYMYDVNRNLILKINKNTYKSLEEILNNNIDLNDSRYKAKYGSINEMKKQGYLSCKRFDEIVHPLDPMLPYILDSKLNMIILQVTQQCNFRCKYCVYSDGYENRKYTNQVMSIETAKRGIDFLLKHSANSESVHIAFYGGEPLLRFDFIKECIEYAKEQFEGKKLLFNMTTNGSLIDDTVIEYLVENNMGLVISLDGPKNIHDKNRVFAGNKCGTFDKVIETLEMIRTKYPSYFKEKVFLSAVIDSQCNFEDVNKFFTNCDTVKEMIALSALINDTYRTSKVGINKDFITKYGYETFKIYLNKLKRIDDKSISNIFMKYSQQKDMMFKRFSEPEDGLLDTGHPGGPCIPGGTRLFMDVSGNLYPCEKVSEASEVAKIGHVDTGFNIEKARSLLNIGKLTQENCKNCWAFRYCELCAAAADSLTKLSPEKKLVRCESIRNGIEGLMKDYCTLKEFGYNPQNDVGNEIPVYECI
ncbi:Cys-rich peptide radical SAM maturase CcpM [Clostridium cibarium]|uniref:Cys-rich peptide radical SAM maturase CcpM n=1 Tax=Clostridium cibarium TaxID=2762247 RepID=A0ABR8PWL1_9CLOT|nr:Cys-rich peptide radical SAM maturase CcpM [Clostridium cibarium]MBD7912581.1 Cys-rich peptide radical SAM maturase CcpM [Clostridium cibarium]